MIIAAGYHIFHKDGLGINQVITNDMSYGASADLGTARPAVSTARYYPADKISFFATNTGGKLGVGLWGDPPEVDAASFFPVGQSEVSPFVYVMQWMEKFMPVLYNPNSLWVATEKGNA